MPTPVDTQLLIDVTEAANKRAGWYGRTYLRDAAALLGELLEAGQRHGVKLSEWDYVANLPGAAVDVLWRQDRYHKPPQTGAAAVALLQHVKDALARDWEVDAETPGSCCSRSRASTPARSWASTATRSSPSASPPRVAGCSPRTTGPGSAG